MNFLSTLKGTFNSDKLLHSLSNYLKIEKKYLNTSDDNRENIGAVYDTGIDVELAHVVAEALTVDGEGI